MGIYLNPGNAAFAEAVHSRIYVDKTGLIEYTNEVLGTNQKNICVSRPRRFGKSMAANMLAAYYGKGCDSAPLFDGYQISQKPTYRKYMNQYDVIFLNMQTFLSEGNQIGDVLASVNQWTAAELLKAYPDVDYQDKSRLTMILQNIFAERQSRFVFIIDEWDCIFREHKNDQNAQKKYLDFLRNLLKDRTYVALAYMTGILPVKKYGTHSALNMFDEYSMTDPGQLTEYVGFLEEETKSLCRKYKRDFAQMQEWYDGYRFDEHVHIYNPKSVVDAVLRGKYRSYWTRTETYEALKIYLDMNFGGLKEAILLMLGGSDCRINPEKFQNDMTTFQSRDDVLTLLIHLGYLAYDLERQAAFIPNKEIEQEFRNALEDADWTHVTEAMDASAELLQAIWNGDEKKVASGIEAVHMDTASVLTYNNENSLSCVISIACYAAKEYYTVIREMPSGKGFADIVFLPRKNHIEKPAMIIELKWDKSAGSGISQIKDRKYMESLKEYQGNLLLVGISYHTETKVHECVIERMVKK